ncbi:hypothetical protein K435DRAFT_821711 [Dendrothele bispora CBS 962.96]|uniref:CxC1-like cysteine cluster associated with KDZ transposases domain-containing protein n=1 Tax=Dendrothele bispora (strain CBS 962.96) TaxID=1314807 RepID=A0A4S8LI20_DENBC|nr:hypothetical protein K435DRAFT_821711 [Dendrothele bispora CBS 962.96]
MLIDDNDFSASPADNHVQEADVQGADVSELPDPERSAECFVIEVSDLLKPRRSRYPVHSKRIRGQRKDKRTWRDRLHATQAKWDALVEPLTDAFISWKYSNAVPSVTTSENPRDFQDNSGFDFGIEVLDIHNLARSALIQRDENTEAAVALVQAGFLGNTPEQPSIAVSLRTLQLLYDIRLFKASFSIEAFTRVLCHIVYRRYYRTAVSNAFDVYLAIRRNLDQRVLKVLGRDTPHYRVLNSCPACCYKLEEEPHLIFSRMWVCDGNNSLRRMTSLGDRRTGDARVFQGGDYFLSAEFVNKYADEVKSKPENKPGSDDEEEDDHDDNNLEDGGDPTDGSTSNLLSTCTNNWKAASADSKKRMWNIFDETGLFASACRHGLILWLADMVRSGELAKYGLAMVGMALEVFGDDWIMGYDIGCSFSQTIKSSSLAPQFNKRNCRTCVNAFHGYSHNFLCQLFFHPINIPGMGLEDLETLERVFSSSNQLASITRYATAYRRRVLIDLFFRQWDEEKYCNMANMLYNNYIQALTTIHEEGQELAEGLATLGLTADDLEKYFDDESQHFQNLGTETEEDLHAVAYVELLQKYREISQFRTQTPVDYRALHPSDSYNQNLSITRKTETSRRYLSEKRDQVHFELVQLECSMNIAEGQRWKPTDAVYLKTLEYMSVREYRQALEHLHKLIVQRLYELHRLNLSQTGYKMRTHIANALQRRSKAVQRAVKRYNAAAQALKPPRPTLDWTKVSHFSFLDQFNILQDTRHSLFNKPWSKPIVRELMKKHRQVSRAKEEIIRCNIELRRLHTSIVDEDRHFSDVLKKLEVETTPMHGPVAEYVQHRRRINQYLMERIQQTYDLEGFSGTPRPGVRKGSSTTTSPLPSHASHPSIPNQIPPILNDPPCDDKARNYAASDDSDSDEDRDIERDDDLQQGVAAVVDFISNLSVHG